VSDIECIHGLALAACDSCSPKKAPIEPEAATTKARTPRAAPVRRHAGSVRAQAERRLHVVLTIDDLADFFAAGELIDPIYSSGPGEIGWDERLLTTGASDQVVLVVRADVAGGPTSLTVESIQLVAVANIVVQERVRELLAMTDYRTRVAVHPPWFQPSE
jgi:hypothetical protein